MPGLDLSQLSSNWKKLQAQLQPEIKESNGLKRKWAGERASPTTSGFKKAKHSARPQVNKQRKMGGQESKPATGQHAVTTTHAHLAKKHDIAPSDIAVAYSNANILPHSDDRQLANTGLHPTHKAGKYIALDCEMVGTGPPPHLDNILARASIVNYHGEQLYDSYVLPRAGEEVHDYRTHVSGIQPVHLLPSSARPFSQVQTDVATLLSGRILVGHALGNDLQVLKLLHPERDMRDTSRYAKFRKLSQGKRPALRNLAKSELGLTIQTGEHSSVEDARAAMSLFRKEKVGFEDESRRRFGVRKKLSTSSAEVNGVLAPRAAAQDEDDDDEDDDAELAMMLDGEDDDLAEFESDNDGDDAALREPPTIAAKKKKRKKKKRTKRK